MSTSKFSGAKGNNQTPNLHQTNQSADGANTFLLGTPTDGAPLQPIENQLQTSAEPESAVIKVENQIDQTPVLPKRKRKAGVKDSTRDTKEIHDGCKRLKNAKASLKSKGNELTDEVTNLAMHIMQTESNRSENSIQLRESIVQLQARNAQLKASVAQLNASIAQLENESNARELNKENDSELGQAKN